MGDGDDDGIARRLMISVRALGQESDSVFLHDFVGIGPGVVDIDHASVVVQFADDIDDPGVPDVRAVFLEGDPE